MTTTTVERVPEPTGVPSEKLSPVEWLKRNLFNNWYNTAITIVLAGGLALAAYRGFRWLFLTAEWEIVRTNLTLSMIGTFPRSELWRVWAQVFCLLAGIGLASGTAYHAAVVTATEAGTEDPETQSVRNLATRFWPMILLVVVLLSFTRTWEPTLWTIVSVAILLAASATGRRIPARFQRWAYLAVAALFLASLQVVTGLDGIAWFPAALIVAAGLWMATSSLDLGGATTAARLVAALIGAAFITWLFRFLGALDRLVTSSEGVTTTEYRFRGVGWEDWGGLQLSIFIAAIGIVLAFPVGLLLAIGRRSDLPVMRGLCTGLIEMVRGVPLIAILLVGVKALEFFFPPDFDVPSTVTLAAIAVLMFSAAYIAEIVRGGLQAVDRGQIEAAQAVGLSPAKVQRLIVLPQALRAVIPSMVGQFISLFKDTSLLAIIGIFDLLRWSEVSNAQPAFFGTQGFAQTLPYAMFIYWALSYTMSRESQRLERRLGVGQR